VNFLKRQMSVANAISVLALFVALSGAAYAATTLAQKSVKTRHLARGAVTTQKLRNGAVTAAKLRNGAVIGSKLGLGAVGSSQLLDGGVRSADLGGGVVTTGKLKDGAVTSEKLASSAVTTPKLAADSVATGKIEDGAVTGAKLAPAFSAQLVKDVAYVTKASATDGTDEKSVTAECPTGKQVTGGGARVVRDTLPESEGIHLVDSFPALSGEGKRTGWTATAREIVTANTGTWTLEVYAICAAF